MPTFDDLVSQIISQNTEYPVLRTVIEKEILHFDILRSMNSAGFQRDIDSGEPDAAGPYDF